MCFSTYTLLYSVLYSSKQYRELQAGEYPCRSIVANGNVMEQFQFHYSVAYSALVECKNLGNMKEL